jgi:flagellar basal body-associated protein FliL
MVQPPQPAETHGHPEPEPVPRPEPEPPQPIPPPDPLPAPEPPHVSADAGPTRTTTGAVPTVSIAGAESPRDATVSIAGAESPRDATDFIDAAPEPAPVEFPPVGAYPGEPGHPATAASTELLPAVQLQDTAQFQQPPVWQPAEPWHAHHERPGEWQTHPPEHLAWEHSPPPETLPPEIPPWQVPLTAVDEPRRRRSALWVSLALTVTLLLCGGGAVSAYFLISNADTGKGAPDPATAVNRFLTAVYTEQNASAAGNMVCRDARDAGKLAARVSQIKDYANEYQGPVFRWSDPAVGDQTADRAVVTVQLTMATDDEKTAQQTLTITTVHKTGWLVCDVSG